MLRICCFGFATISSQFVSYAYVSLSEFGDNRLFC